MNLSKNFLLSMFVSMTIVSSFKLHDYVEVEETREEANTRSLLRHYRRDIQNPKSEKSSEPTFSESLFNDEFSVKVRNAVLETKFFQKMINNTLKPEEYGGYMVQDAAYVYDAVKAFDIAAEKTQGDLPSEFPLFYRGRSASFTNYAAYFKSSWKLQDTKSVVMGPAAATYVAYEMNLSRTKPRYLSIGILPCDMLWPWVAKQLDSLVPKTNVYRSWVDDNLPDDGSTSSTQEFVNKFFNHEDIQTCQTIFNEGIINELNFFRSACGEDLVDYSFGLSEQE